LEKSKDYGEILKNKKMRNTKHRKSVIEIIELNGQPITAEEIFLKLKGHNVTISLSTVYRVLEALTSNGLISKSSVTDDNKNLFEINSLEHKHHLFCVKCRKLFSVNGCPLEDYEKDLENKFGFEIEGHKLEMYGRCECCKRNDKNI